MHERVCQFHIALCLLVAAWPLAAGAQAEDSDLGSNSTFLISFPELRQLPAPESLGPALRVSYATAAGGLIQYDVIAKDGTQVLVTQTDFIDPGDGLRENGSQSLRGYPGLGDFWIQPSVLARAERVASDTTSVTRLTKSLADGAPVSVVRFQTTTSTGQTAVEFDTDSGFMVFQSIQSGLSAAQMRLLGWRTIALPWALGRAPNWVRPGAMWRYEGSELYGVVSAGGTTSALTIEVRLIAAGARWSVAEFSSSRGGVAQPTARSVTGEAQLLGGLWIPVSALSVSLSIDGALIDTDPYTEARVYLARGVSGEIVIQQVTPFSRVSSLYHPTLGILERSTSETVNLGAVRNIDYARVGGDDALQALATQEPLAEAPSERLTLPKASEGGCQFGRARSNLAGPTLLVLALILVRQRGRRAAA